MKLGFEFQFDCWKCR